MPEEEKRARAELWSQSLVAFREAVSQKPMPGCGAAAVVSADLGLALVLKGLYLGQQHERRAPRAILIDEGESLKQRLSPLADEDVVAFEGFTRALSLPKEPAGQRRDALHRAALEAIRVPLETARLCQAALSLAIRALLHTEKQFIGDALAGGRLLHAALHSVLGNVDANAGALDDDQARQDAERERQRLADESDRLLSMLLKAPA